MKVSNFIPDNRSNNVFREASVSVIKLTSQSSLDSEHVINALCTKVLIKLSLRFFGQNESQQMYKPVKVGLRYTLVRKQEASLYTRTSRNGSVELLAFLRVNQREGCILLRWEKKFASLNLTTKYTECVKSTHQVLYTNQPHRNP